MTESGEPGSGPHSPDARRPMPDARIMTGKVLIVEDQPAVAKALQVLLELRSIDVISTDDPDQALQYVRSGDIDLVLQDMNLSPGATHGDEGVHLFRRLRALDPDLPILLITAWTSLETAVQLVKEGAADYLAKPWDDEKLLTTTRNLLKLRSLRRENDRLRLEKAVSRSELERRYDLSGMVYESAEMARVVSLALQVSGSDVPVLITGPNGVGKEKIAEIIHANSRRKQRSLIRVNAGGLPDELLESELFGAQPGAYTGATRLRIGRFETANGGTLFLDEIGNLSLAGQAKLLRVLQSGEFERLGSSETIRVDVRLLCATNADLKAAIRKGTFREDLYFRLNVIEVDVPPLRDRRDDIIPLAETFLRVYSRGSGRTLTAESRAALLRYDWPGNVRELQNRVQRSAVVAARNEITPEDLGLSASRGEAAEAVPSSGASADRMEKIAIEEAILRAGGSVSRAAEQLGLSRQSLYRKMEKLGITLERRP